jgi:regulator of cell morphogenesis and NO signaling
MQTNQSPTVSDLVRADYRLADVFKKWNINYCCGGNEPLDQVCQLQGLDLLKVEQDMQASRQAMFRSNAVSFDSWPVDFLADYIVHVHHAYIKAVAPELEQTFAAFVQGHQKKYPYLTNVHGVLKKLIAMLLEQVQHQEDVIFPYIKQVNNAFKRKESYGQLFVRTLHKSLRETTGKAQQQTLSALTNLRNATQQYQFPDTVCTKHQVFYHKLKELDADVVQHKHLEHTILFPKVVQMEQELLHG